MKQVDIEHIVPKSTHGKFTFYGKNLALSCPACNTKKGDKDVLTKSIINYPRSGNSFKLIHAHFDSYSEHIKILNESIYTALTSKGSETITMCSLYRLHDVEENIKLYTSKKSPVSYLTEALRTGEPEEIADLIKELKKHLE